MPLDDTFTDEDRAFIDEALKSNPYIRRSIRLSNTIIVIGLALIVAAFFVEWHYLGWVALLAFPLPFLVFWCVQERRRKAASR